jgi:outer membrane translocation and assembly module TamA
LVVRLKAHDLKVAQPLRQDRYEGRKRAISNLTLRRGYCNGRFTAYALRVDPAAGHVDIRLRYV